MEEQTNISTAPLRLHRVYTVIVQIKFYIQEPLEKIENEAHILYRVHTGQTKICSKPLEKTSCTSIMLYLHCVGTQ